MIQLGRKNTMRAERRVDFGMYLTAPDYPDRVLLPERYVPEGLNIGDDIEVFLYLDNEERLIATTDEPVAQAGEFAYMRVRQVNQYGAFLEWGIMKDLLCPFREQKQRMEEGRSYIVHVHVDDDSYRVMASAKVEHFLQDHDGTLHAGDKVPMLVWQKTDLGFKVIVADRFAGLLYDSQIFRDLHTGDRLEGYIAKVRDDGKLDCTLQPQGHERATDFSARLLTYLQTRGGRCWLHDKSPAEDIKAQFGVSKRTYKQAVGDLYRQHLITLTDSGIELV